MQKPVLAIMAAGMGSRYGGCKQIDPMDAYGNLIIDFSIYDALQAGFEDVIFIIKHAIEADFREAIGDRIARYANVTYAFQELSMLPAGLTMPAGRQKPYGTTHCVLCAEREIAGRAFAAINADDFYGRRAYQLLFDFLTAEKRPGHHALVGYHLPNTLTDAGSVSRGVCAVQDGYLTHIVERIKVVKTATGSACLDSGEAVPIPDDATASMNFWGFQNDMLDFLRENLARNLQKGFAENPLKYEDLLPNAVQDCIAQNRGSVKVLPTPDRWCGVTYPEDKPGVMAAIAEYKAKGVYPEQLWK